MPADFALGLLDFFAGFALFVVFALFALPDFLLFFADFAFFVLAIGWTFLSVCVCVVLAPQ